MNRTDLPRTVLAPSGQQISLRYERQHAVIVEVSGGVRLYEVDGEQMLDGYGEEEMSNGAQGQLLVPWPNRLRDGRYEFDGETHGVPLSEPAAMNAIHGFLRWESWRVSEQSADHAVMEHTLHPRAGYPFHLHVAVDYRLDAGGLTAAATATNVGTRRCPYGMGAHPYLRVGAGIVDSAWLEAPGHTHLTADDRGIPTGRADAVDSPFDFRSRRRILGTVLDTAFTDVERDAAGLAWVRLWDGAQTHGVGLWMDEGYPYYMLFSGDTLPEASSRRRSLAVEPMTCAPNAFASGDGLIVLEPGERVVSRWGITPLGPPAPAPAHE